MATKAIQVLVAVKFLFKGNKVFQYFTISTDDRKNIIDGKYLRDSRYIVYDKLNEKIKEVALHFLDDKFTLVERRDDEEKITMEYTFEGDVVKYKPFYFTIAGFVPNTPGCDDCKYKGVENKGCFFCEVKNKTLTQKIKSCSVFRQKELFKT